MIFTLSSIGVAQFLANRLHHEKILKRWLNSEYRSHGFPMIEAGAARITAFVSRMSSGT